MANAKFINKLLTQTKADAKTIADQRRQLDTAQAESDARLAAARDKLAQEHAAELAQLRASHKAEMEAEAKRHNEDWHAAAERHDAQLRALNTVSTKANNLEVERDTFKQQVDNLTLINSHQDGRIKELETMLATIQPELALLETKKQELTQLCEKVRERMRRKEREEEQAILNRKAINGVVPGPLRR